MSVGGWLSPLPEADRVSGLTEGRGEDRRRSDRAAATVDSQRRGRTPWHDRAGGSARSGGASARRPVVGKRRRVAALGRRAGADIKESQMWLVSHNRATADLHRLT